MDPCPFSFDSFDLLAALFCIQSNPVLLEDECYNLQILSYGLYTVMITVGALKTAWIKCLWMSYQWTGRHVL